MLFTLVFAQQNQDIQKNRITNNGSFFFIVNKGQWDSNVLYFAKLNGMAAWITRTGFGYCFSSTKADNTQIIKINYVNANSPDFSQRMKNEDSSDYSSFLSSDEFIDNNIIIHNIYDGIDIHYYFDKEEDGSIGFRYDFIVNPGADINQIKFKLEGADKYEINSDGELVLHTSFGEIRHGRLFTYQYKPSSIDSTVLTSDELSEVACKFIINHDRTIGFMAGNYDKSKQLIIDPLVYCTYIGGNVTDYSPTLIIDSIGNSYITGFTSSLDYPTTPGAYNSINNDNDDSFITKLNSSGSDLVYSTYLGGNQNDFGDYLAIDNYGNTYITGLTLSSDFPTTNNAYNRNSNGDDDGYITKLNSTGSTLIYSTYIGGSAYDCAIAIIVDLEGNSIITGNTYSTNYPTTMGAYNVGYNGGSTDIILTKMNKGGSAFVFSTYMGGSQDENSFNLVTDSYGNYFITGNTNSSDFPVTNSVYDKIFNGIFDIFLSGVNYNGSALIHSTFIGGSDYDCGTYLSSDNNGDFYIAGSTSSTDYPTTIGAYDRSYGGIEDAFIIKMKSDATAPVFSTYLGGSAQDASYAVIPDRLGNTFIVGSTSSSDFPITNEALFKSLNGSGDGFYVKLNYLGSSLIYSTFFGGSDSDSFMHLALDSNGYVYLDGSTYSSDNPVTDGAFDRNLKGTSDIFIAKMRFPECDSISIDPSSINFEGVQIGTSKDESLHIKNNGNNDAVIESINNLVPPFELITTVPNLPAILKPGEELVVGIRYTPIDTTGDTLIIKINSTSPCNIELKTVLTGIGISEQNIVRKASVYIDPLNAATGQTVSMPLMLRSSENLIINGQTREFSARIRFNATLLAPNETPDNDIITNGERTIEVSGSISTPSGVMKMMNYTTALGNSKCTDLIIDTVIWKNINVEITKENGKFCLTNVCPEGGDRLLNPNGSTQILSVHPNPTSGDSGFTEFLIINYLGETVKKVELGEINDFNTQSITINLDDLSSGQYYLILRTPTESIRQLIMIVR
jgi:hypothetical protein